MKAAIPDEPLETIARENYQRLQRRPRPAFELIKGDISETLPRYLEANPHLIVGLLHLDVDLYKPTKDTIELLVERIPKGGIIFFDEPNHQDYPGETIAVMETLLLVGPQVPAPNRPPRV